MTNQVVQRSRSQKRVFGAGVPGDEDLGPLRLLPGEWRNDPGSPGRGWNLIALPFATPGEIFNYRLLLNQYNETLTFSVVDKGVPNRGIRRNEDVAAADQLVVTLDYQQSVTQIAAGDFPQSGQAGDPGAAIHHEPGLWLYMLNERTDDLDIARLATISHGDSALALGRSTTHEGPPQIPDTVSALPIGVRRDVATNPYLAPYKHFVDTPFKGVLDRVAGFSGFCPIDTTNLLKQANAGVDIAKTTTLSVDTTVESGGIVNLPFIVKQANASDMKSTFWIQKLVERDEKGRPQLRLQYLQVVMLDFFPRPDGLPGPIRWPHISINTMAKVTH